jgi:hypothetical protein
MTPIYNTAFAHGVLNANGPTSGAMWDGVGDAGGTVSISSTINRRSGGFSLDLNKTVTTSTTLYRYRSFTASAVVVLRVYIRFQTSLPSGLCWFFALEDSGGAGDLEIGFNSSDNKLRVKFASGTETISSSTVTADTWYRLDIRADVSSSSTYTCDWSIDGITQTQHTKAVSAARTIDRVVFGNGLTANTLAYRVNYTDFVLSTTSGDYPIGAGTGYYLLPNDQGTHVNSGRFQDGDSTAIDANSEALLDDWPPVQTGGNTDYVKQITADGAGEDSYLEILMQDRSDSEGTINAVEAFVAYSAATTTSNNAATVVKRNDGTQVAVHGSFASPADYSDGSITNWFYAAAQVTPPGGGWTTSELDALVFRFGGSTDTNPNPYVSGLLIEYDVAPAAGGGGGNPWHAYAQQ